jgi:hypothetical protein
MLTTIAIISAANINGDTPTLVYQPETPAGEEPFLFTECELREIVQATVAACYDISDCLGIVADHWAAALLHYTPHAPDYSVIAGDLDCTTADVEELTVRFRDVARDVHEAETGLPSPW